MTSPWPLQYSGKLALLATALTASGALPLSAQQFHVDYVQPRTTHRLRGDPNGVAAAIDFPVTDRFAVRLGGAWLRSVRDRIGIPCSGLLPPTGCEQEPLHDASKVAEVGVSLAAALVRRRPVALWIVPAVRKAHAGTDTRAATSGRQLSDGQSFWVRELGVELALTPRTSWPVALQLAVRTSVWSPREVNRCCDGYWPFNERLRVSRVEIGLIGLNRSSRTR